jgi:hypothetical protein
LEGQPTSGQRRGVLTSSRHSGDALCRHVWKPVWLQPNFLAHESVM